MGFQRTSTAAATQRCGYVYVCPRCHQRGVVSVIPACFRRGLRERCGRGGGIDAAAGLLWMRRDYVLSVYFCFFFR